MRTTWLACALLLGACGGGGGGGSSSGEAVPLTVQELVQTCVADDVLDVSGLLELLQNLLAEDATPPQIELNVIQFLIDGTIGFSLDVDRDGTADLSGTVGFRDKDGRPTFPDIDLDEITSGRTPDLEEVLASIDDGTVLTLTFEVEGSSSLARDMPAASGEFAFTFEGGTVASVSGSGTIESADCTFDFRFDDVLYFDYFDGAGYPTATLDFELGAGRQGLGGTIELDGSRTGHIAVRNEDGSEEEFMIDLETGELL